MELNKEDILSAAQELIERRSVLIEKQKKLHEVGEEMLKRLNAGLDVSNEYLAKYQQEILELANEVVLVEVEAKVLSYISLSTTDANSTSATVH
jgi:hypothetical protein